MADKRNKTNVKINRALVYVGGDTAWYWASLDIEWGYEPYPIHPGSAAEPIGFKVGMRKVKGTITFMQLEAEQSRTVTGSTSTPWHALTPGTDIPTVTLQIHDPTDGDATNDLFVYAASFLTQKRLVDGKGLAGLQVTFEGTADSNDKFFRTGMTA